MSPLLIFQQAGLVQLPSSVNSCSPSDNQASSQTNMTIDMNAVSSLCLADLLQQNPVMTGSPWLVPSFPKELFSDGVNVLGSGFREHTATSK